MKDELPDSIADLDALEELLSRPSAAAIEAMGRISGDLILLGVAGKMGPSLARMAVRASKAAGTPRRVIGVSRFSNPQMRQQLESLGVATIQGDLLDEEFVAALPPVENVIYMPALKFGATGSEARVWAVNALLPAFVCRRFAGSRIAAFSTGNVYPLSPADGGGSRESDPPNPVGEYGMSCLGRERMFEYFSRARSIPVATLRLNYAVEMRYGVLVDIAQRVLAGEPISLAMGWVNVLWQADANAMALAALADASSPPWIVNLAGPETLRVREIAEAFGRLLGATPRFVGEEGATALLSDGRLAHGRYGPPRVTAEKMIEWTADWLRREMPTLGKPTRFEVRDGRF